MMGRKHLPKQYFLQQITMALTKNNRDDEVDDFKMDEEPEMESQPYKTGSDDTVYG